MESYLAYKFNIDLLKYIGFILATPLATLGFKFLLNNEPFSIFLTLRGLGSLLLTYCGVLCIGRARSIANEIDSTINREGQ